MNGVRVRRGFSRIDLLVLLLVLGLGLGLLVNFLSWSNDSGRTITCVSHLRHSCLAIRMYEYRNGNYPGYINHVNGNERTWTYMVLPFLDRQDIYQSSWPSGSAPPTKSSELFECPADRRTRTTIGPPISYVANSGLPDIPPSDESDPPADWPANGVFHDLRDRWTGASGASSALPKTIVTERNVNDWDGLQNTVMLTENLDAGSWSVLSAADWERQVGCVWNCAVSGTPAVPNPPAAARINANIGGDPKLADIHYARPSSFHPGVFNAAFCDAHVRSINQDIDYLVYCRLMTPSDKKVQLPGSIPRDALDPADPAFPDPIFRAELPIVDGLR